MQYSRVRACMVLVCVHFVLFCLAFFKSQLSVSFFKASGAGTDVKRDTYVTARTFIVFPLNVHKPHVLFLHTIIIIVITVTHAAAFAAPSVKAKDDKKNKGKMEEIQVRAVFVRVCD